MKVWKIKIIITFILLLTQNINAQFNSAKFKKKYNSITPSLNTIVKKETNEEILKEVEKVLEREALEAEQVIKKLKVEKEVKSSKFSLPLDTIIITSQYGLRLHPINKKVKFHRGLDLRAKYENVKAMMGGEIIDVGYNKSYGYYVKMKLSDYTVLYAHLKNYYVQKGERVKAGEIIGTTGNTGLSTAAHLHIETKYKGDYFNPLIFLNNIKLIKDGKGINR